MFPFNNLPKHLFNTKYFQSPNIKKNVFALSAIRGELLEREKGKEIRRERARATNNIKCDKKGGQKV